MTSDDSLTERFLEGLKEDGRSSPAGMYWQEFYELLRPHASLGSPAPPKPLILAASGESDGSKHRRLAEQLAWARDNGCLGDAIRFLQELPSDRWNHGSIEQWEKHDYF